jgi:hypothetical protein
MASRATYGLAGGLAAAGLLFVCPLPGLGQELAAGRPTLRFNLSERLGWKEGTDVNTDEEGLTATTGFGLSLNSATVASRLQFDMSGGLRKNLSNGDTSTRNPLLRLSYGRQNLSSAMNFDLGYRQDDVDSRYADDDLETDVVQFGTGTQQDVFTKLGFAFGRTAPFGGGFDLGYNSKTYSGTDDPSLLDSERRNASGRLEFQFDPRITGLLRASYDDTEREGNGRDTLYENVAAGASFAVTPTLTTDLFLGRSRVTNSGNIPEETQDGLSFNFSFVQERPNGNWTGSFLSDLNDNGVRRTTARIDRSLDLPRGGIRAGFGLSQSEDTDLRPLYSLAYLHERLSSSLNVSFNQAFTSNDDGDEALNSRLNVSYRRALTDLSSLQAGIVFRSSNYLGNSDQDDSQINLNLSYRHNLAEDWDLVSGYIHRLDNDNNTTDRSDEVFLSIEKSFWRRF